MPPTTIVDTSLCPNGDWYFAIESDSIWRAKDVSVTGSAEWTQVMLALEGATFHRVIAPTNSLVYVLATVDGDTYATGKLYRSINSGVVWEVFTIAEDLALGAEYTVNDVTTEHNWPGGVGHIDHDHPRHDGDSTNNPWGLAVRGIRGANSIWIDLDNDEAYAINNFKATNLHSLTKIRVYHNESISAGERTKLYEWCTDYFGAEIDTTWEGSSPGELMPKDPARNKVRWKVSHDSGDVTLRSVTFWNYPQPVKATAMAVAPSNAAWIYVGFEEQIVRSYDSGETWEVVTEEEGANDIAVDPFNGKTITCWTPNGDLIQIIDTEIQAAILTETALDQARRIAYDRKVEGKLFVLANNGTGCDLKRYTGGSWTTLQSTIVGAACILVSPTTTFGTSRVAYLSGDNIYYSIDDGVSVAAKKGDWSVSAPVSIDFLP